MHPASVTRTAAFFVLSCIVIVGWAVRVEETHMQLAAQDRRQDEAVIRALYESRGRFPQESRSGVFKVAMVGGSESAGMIRTSDVTDNLPLHLARQIGSKKYRDVMVSDFSQYGAGAAHFHAQVQRAVEHDADLIVATTTVFSAYFYFGTERAMGQEGPRLGLYQQPSLLLDHFLRRWVKHYDTRFSNSLGRLVGNEDKQTLVGLTLPRGASGDLADALFYERLDFPEVPASARRAIELNPPEDPADRLRLLLAPALHARIPVLYVVTPFREAGPTGILRREDAYEFEGVLRGVDHRFAAPKIGLHYWPAYRENWSGRLEFRDLVHMATPSYFAERLLDEAVERGLMPAPPAE